MSRKKNSNSIVGAFVVHTKEMRESPAWRALPNNAKRVLEGLELEHMRHAGTMNGELPFTYDNFESHGIRRASIALAIREAIMLGFLEVTRQGYRSSGGARVPSLYRLTYVYSRRKTKGGTEPTHEWRQLTTADDAGAALAWAKAQKNTAKQARPRLRKQNPGRENASSMVTR